MHISMAEGRMGRCDSLWGGLVELHKAVGGKSLEGITKHCKQVGLESCEISVHTTSND